MMEICVYVGCILVLWIILSIQNLPGNAGRDQGDRDGWAEPWASDLPSLHHGCFICMLHSVVSDSVTPWAATRQAPLSTVTICSDFGDPQNKSLSLFPLFPHIFAMK